MISKLLEQHYYNGKIGVMLVTQNVTITTAQKSAAPIYAKYQLMPLRNRMGTLCSIEQSGILQITLFVDVANGTDLIDAKAQEIVDWFGTEKARYVLVDSLGRLFKLSRYTFTLAEKPAINLTIPPTHFFKERFMVMSSTAMGAMSDGTGKYMQPISVEYRVI